MNKREQKILENVGITIDQNKNYAEDEFEEILEEIYFNESTNVDYDDELAEKLAHIADKIESMRED